MKRRCSRPRTHLFAALALLAMLLNALAPAISTLWRPAYGPGDWAQVCSAAGTRWVRVDAEGGTQSRKDRQPQTTEPRCPYCLPHAANFQLDVPPSAEILPGLHTADDPARHPGRASPRDPGRWARPAARAPPGLAMA